MVLVPGLRGAKVAVYSGVKCLREHRGPKHENKDLRTSKYIECKPGDEFKIVIQCDERVELRAEALCIRIYVDGVYCDSRVCDQSIVKKGLVMHSIGRRTSHQTCLPYTFSQIELSDQAPQLSQERLCDVGTIKIEFTHVRRGGPIDDNLSPLESADSMRPKTLKKQHLSCAVGFGKTQEHVRLGGAIEVESNGVEHVVLLHYRTCEELAAIGSTPKPDIIDLTTECSAANMDASRQRPSPPKKKGKKKQKKAQPVAAPKKPAKVKKMSKKQRRIARFKDIEAKRRQGQVWLSDKLERLLIDGAGGDLGINAKEARNAIRSAAYPPEYVYYGGPKRQQNLKKKREAEKRLAVANDH